MITFGSFYGGSLAAYLRFKYPNEISGSLASGATVRMADEFQARTQFWKRVTQSYQQIPGVRNMVSRVLGPKIRFYKN